MAGSGAARNSLPGGIAAQEIAKAKLALFPPLTHPLTPSLNDAERNSQIITQHYVPFNNTLVFDGIKSVSKMLEF